MPPRVFRGDLFAEGQFLCRVLGTIRAQIDAGAGLGWAGKLLVSRCVPAEALRGRAGVRLEVLGGPALAVTLGEPGRRGPDWSIRFRSEGFPRRAARATDRAV
jgi:hypothetical protein